MVTCKIDLHMTWMGDAWLVRIMRWGVDASALKARRWDPAHMEQVAYFKLARVGDDESWEDVVLRAAFKVALDDVVIAQVQAQLANYAGAPSGDPGEPGLQSVQRPTPGGHSASEASTDEPFPGQDPLPGLE